MNKSQTYSIFWFRRDLRLFDNCGLFHALKSGYKIIPLYIFDSYVIHELEKNDARISLLYKILKDIHHELVSINSGLCVEIGQPEHVFQKLTQQFNIHSVFTNSEYEPYSAVRDQKVNSYLSSLSISTFFFKDQVFFEKDSVLKSDSSPYTIFTPYSKKWKEKYSNTEYIEYPSEQLISNFAKISFPFPELSELGFEQVSVALPEIQLDNDFVKKYSELRNIPSVNGTSQLSVHLRMGTQSIRQIIHRVSKQSETLLNELIWREFFSQILMHFPETVSEPFQKKFRFIRWRNNEQQFIRWSNGETGYPIVDAGMRQLNQTGLMHNRVRMITASFLCKHLLIDWRWGEAYFAKKLLDYDLASNVGNWQWAASTGCDAVPYFRIFNPELQQKKFDPNQEYIKKWIPEYRSSDYIKPIVEHASARSLCLEEYKHSISQYIK